MLGHLLGRLIESGKLVAADVGWRGEQVLIENIARGTLVYSSPYPGRFKSNIDSRNSHKTVLGDVLCMYVRMRDLFIGTEPKCQVSTVYTCAEWVESRKMVGLGDRDNDGGRRDSVLNWIIRWSFSLCRHGFSWAQQSVICELWWTGCLINSIADCAVLGKCNFCLTGMVVQWQPLNNMK